MALWALAMFWATAASVAVTAIGTYFIWRTLDTNREATKAAANAATAATRANEIAQESAERQLRAYVVAYDAHVGNLDGPGPLTGNVTSKNFGLTPAYKVMHWSNFRVISFPSDTRFPDAEFRDTASVAVLASGVPMETNQKGPVINDLTRDAIKNGQAAIYLSGELRYLDAFRKPHFHRYRFMFGGDAGVPTFEQDGKQFGTMAPAPEGNETDDD